MKIPSTIKEVRDLEGNLLVDPSQYFCSGCTETSDFALRMKNVSEAQVVIPTEASNALRSAMRKVMTQGTGYRVGLGLPKDVIGKTGTTNHARDVWFIGHTTSLGPDPLLIATYIGYDKPQPIAKGASGARIAGTVFRDIVLGTLNGDVKIRNQPVSENHVSNVYKATSGLNMRSANNASSKVLRVIPANATVVDVTCDGSWCKGKYRQRVGYFSQRYVRRVANGKGITSTEQVPDRFKKLRRFMAASGGTYVPNPVNDSLQIAGANANRVAQAGSSRKKVSFGSTAKKKKRKPQKNTKRSIKRIIDGVEVTVNYNFN